MYIAIGFIYTELLQWENLLDFAKIILGPIKRPSIAWELKLHTVFSSRTSAQDKNEDTKTTLSFQKNLPLENVPQKTTYFLSQTFFHYNFPWDRTKYIVTWQLFLFYHYFFRSIYHIKNNCSLSINFASGSKNEVFWQFSTKQIFFY